MSGFNFSTTAGASQSTVKPPFKGNDIYDVKFDGCEIKDFEGKKDPSKTYKTIVAKFSNEEASFEHSIFEPRVDGFDGVSDFDRGTSTYTDKKTGEERSYPTPSVVESAMLFFKHLIDVANPKIAKAIDDKTKNLGAPDWDSIRTMIVKITTPGIGTETKIKLINNKNGEPKFPGYFTAVNQAGDAYIKNNFIGDRVGFTAYEMKRIQKASEAKPTDMDKTEGNLLVDDIEDTSLDLGFDLDAEDL